MNDEIIAFTISLSYEEQITTKSKYIGNLISKKLTDLIIQKFGFFAYQDYIFKLIKINNYLNNYNDSINYVTWVEVIENKEMRELIEKVTERLKIGL